ncbi:MAG TPA: PEGA domain-containing protein [Vicinamibacterales bacterium]|nr:PEGA domain-containing protein [Vicinamibacterales bacterium]
MPRDGGAQPQGGVRPAPGPSGGAVVDGGARPYYGTRGSYVFVGGYFYDPFYGPYPWWPRSAYGWGYYPVFDYRAEVRIQATPREAAVYVDGFYAGIVDDFDGTFQRLPLTPGGHRIELFLDGFRTVRKNLYLQPGSTIKMHDTLVPLAAGETSEPPEVAPPVPPPPDGSYNEPRGAAPRSAPPVVRRGGRPERGDAEGFGTLVLHVQPREAEVSIDGQRWLTSGDGEFEVQLPAGRHRVEVELQGFQRFSTEVDVRDDAPTPINISLTRGR